MVVSLAKVVDGLDMVSGEVYAYLNLVTSEIFTLGEEDFDLADADEEKELPDWQLEVVALVREVNSSTDYVRLPTQYEVNEYEIMRDFCYTVQNAHIHQQLMDAIHGSGAFRRFKQAINRYNLEQKWYAFRKQALGQIGMEWLESNEIAYTNDL